MHTYTTHNLTKLLTDAGVTKNLKEFLESNSKGKEILSLYSTKKKVDRAKLANLLIDAELEKNPDTR